jgi:ribosomal protein S18 acetylase RimI-like enzyme
MSKEGNVGMCDAPTEVVGELRIDELRPGDVVPLQRFYNSLAEEIVRTFRPYGWDLTADCLADGPLARIAAGDEFALAYRDEAGNIWGHAFLMGILSDDGAMLGLGVHQLLLGKELGRKLMAALMQAAERLGIKRIHLSVVQDNAPAVELYKANGFEITEEFVSDLDNLPYYNMVKVFQGPTEGPSKLKSGKKAHPRP